MMVARLASAYRAWVGIPSWLAVCILIPLALLAGASIRDRTVVLENQQSDIRSTVEALAAHVGAVLDASALALDLALNTTDTKDWAEISGSQSVEAHLFRLDERLPAISHVFLVDPDGTVAVSSRGFPPTGTDVGSTDLIRDALAHPGAVAVGSLGIQGPTYKGQNMAIARARLVNGAPDGVAVAVLSDSSLRELFRTVLEPQSSSAAAVVRTDGLELFRYPRPLASGFRLAANSPTMAAASRGPSVQSFTAVSLVDGQLKVGAVMRIPGWDLIVAYGIDKRQVLGEWYRHLAAFAAIAFFSALALLLTTRRAMQAEQRRHRAEQALEHARRLEALGQLTGGVAHDFNNLLAAVLGSIELVLRRLADPRMRRHLTLAQQAAERGARLTAQMLAFARQQPTETRPVDANAMIKGADELLRRTAGARAQFRRELQADLWLALADPVQLELAIINLIANARDAMPGGGEIVVRTRNLPEQEVVRDTLPKQDFVVISVQDTGEGMPDAVRNRAFEPFFTTKPVGKGTGLGLSMVHGFARQHGGAVTIDTKPGEGTTISIYLPRTAQPMTAPATTGQDQAEVPPLRVLLVDDEVETRTTAREILEELGHKVLDSGSPEAALGLLANGVRFDLLLSDYGMAEMDGYRLAVQARQIVPELPVIIMTGYAEREVIANWRAARFGVLERPFDFSSLAKALGAISFERVA